MALSRFSNASSHQNKQVNKVERRPRMLKDFLQEDTNYSSTSSTLQVVTRNVTDHAQNNNTGKLLRSRSTKATVSALHAIINALKNIPFSASNKTSTTNKMDRNCTVTVKDIMRWKSFRDLAEENSPPSDFGCTTSDSWCSNGSSWCNSDFTSHEYHCYLLEQDIGDEKYLPYCVGVGVGRECMTTRSCNGVGPEGDAVCEEKEQCSPLSVLQVDSQFSEDAHPLSQTRSIVEFDEYENEMEKCWISNGEEHKVFDDKKEECIREMEKGEKWSNFDDEQQQLCFQIQEDLLDSMVDDLLIHLFSPC